MPCAASVVGAWLKGDCGPVGGLSVMLRAFRSGTHLADLKPGVNRTQQKDEQLSLQYNFEEKPIAVLIRSVHTPFGPRGPVGFDPANPP
jgi:hypothetical protein